MKSAPLGYHTLFDFHGCQVERMENLPAMRASLLEAVREAGGTIVSDSFHVFTPQGLSGVVVIAESHVTIHTWPEHRYAAVDVFSCGPKLDHPAIRDRLRDALGAERVEERRFRRGEGLGRALPAADLPL